MPDAQQKQWHHERKAYLAGGRSEAAALDLGEYLPGGKHVV